MALTRAVSNAVILAALYNEIADLLNGTALAGQPVLLTQLSSASGWALTAKNLGSGGQALRVQSAAGVDLLTVSDTGTAIVGGALTGLWSANGTVTMATGIGALKMRSSSSAVNDTGTSDGPRAAVVWLKDTNAASADSAVLKIDFIENTTNVIPTTTYKVRTGIDIAGFTKLDSGGESSCLLFRNTGGGGGIAGYATTRLRPAGYENYSYTPQGAAEFATDNMSQALILQAGFNYPEVPAAAPWPTLTGNTLASSVTLPISDVTLVPTPGGATPDSGPGGAYPTWPTPLYVRIGTDVISYTGKSVTTGAGNLTGCVHGINGPSASSTDAAHLSGAKVEPYNANHALLVRMGTPLAKGITVAALDSIYDTRPAFAVAVPVTGAPADSAYTFKVTMAGALTAAVSVSTATLNAANADITGGLTLRGPVYLLGTISPTQLVANTDNWSPTGLSTARVIRVNIDAARNLTGIVAQAAGTVLTLHNTTAFNLTLIHDATSTAANRFYLPGNANMILTPHSSAEVFYDATASRWACLSGGPG